MDTARFSNAYRNVFSTPISPRTTILIFRFMIPSILLSVYLFVVPLAHGHPMSWLRHFSLSHPFGTGTTISAPSSPHHNRSSSNNGIEGVGGMLGGGNWIWGWAWASDGTVSVVDRSPAITFPARPASFGLDLTEPLLGYVIPLSAFTAPCPPSSGRRPPPSTSTSTTSSPLPRPPSNGSSASSFWSTSSNNDQVSRNEWKFEANPVLGCPDLCISGKHEPDRSEKWIALVQRGGCPFVEKARQAQKLGARAIVVGGDKANPDALLNMYSERDASDVRIAATYIKYWDYAELSNMIASSNTSLNGLRTLSLLLTTEYSAWEWYSPILTFIVILLLPTLLTFVTLLVHRVRAARAAERDRAPEDVVQRLPWRVWTGTGWEKHAAVSPESTPSADNVGTTTDPASGDLERGRLADEEARMCASVATAVTSTSGGGESVGPGEDEPEWVDKQQECVICLDMFAKGDKVRELPCGHIFHMEEVDEWLIHKKKLCPICKADVTRPRGHHHHHPQSPPLSPRSSHRPHPHEPHDHTMVAVPPRTPIMHVPEHDNPSSSSSSSSSSGRVLFPPTERTPLLPPRPAW